MNREVFEAHVRALKAECEALLALMAPASDPANPAPEVCEHPDYQRVPTSTLQGPPSFYCRKCRQEIVDP
jgi:hypothetical protein